MNISGHNFKKTLPNKWKNRGSPFDKLLYFFWLYIFVDYSCKNCKIYNIQYKNMLKNHAEYGGTNSNIDELTNFWKDKVRKLSNWLINQTKLKTDESLRTGKSKSNNIF